MATIRREFKESPWNQGRDEEIAYTYDTTTVGAYSSGAAVKLYDVTNDDQDTDVSATNLSGSASAAGNVITTPLVVDLVPGNKYRLEIAWVSSGNTFERFGYITGER